MSEENQSLPVMITDNEIAEFAKDNKEFVLRLQNFQKLVNKDVEVEKLEKHPFVNAMYLPISFMEMTLDEIFFGLWETKDFKWLQVSNEITATLELRVFHPLAKSWITRTGVGAIQIMTDAIPEPEKKKMSKQQINAWALNTDNKKAGALTNGIFAALKADCFKNACISLGKYFGRDVNRKLTDNFNPLVPDTRGLEKELEKELSEIVSLIQDEEYRTEIATKIVEADGKEDMIQFYQKMIKELGGQK